VQKIYIWRIGSDTDNYIDESSNLSAILNLIHPIKMVYNCSINKAMQHPMPLCGKVIAPFTQ
jgi:hypothetical protein